MWKQKFLEFWAGAGQWTRAIVIAAAVMFAAGLVQALISSVWAVEPGWYGPGDGTARGILVACQPSDACGVIWFDHDEPHEQLWLLAAKPCQRGAACELDLLRPTGSGFGGLFGQADIGPVVGSVSIEPLEDAIRVDWEVIRLLDRCTEDGQPLPLGALLLNKCLGSEIWSKRVGE